MADTSSRRAGLILAGGQARRLQEKATASAGTIDKGFLALGGQPLIERAARWLAPQVEQIFVSANRNLAAYRAYGDVIEDLPVYEAGAGPLAGIASVLTRAGRNVWLLVVPVDVPFLPDDLFSRLAVATTEAGAPAAYAVTSTGPHPLCLLLNGQVLPDLHDYLLQGQRKVLPWLQGVAARSVEFEDEGRFFLNINTHRDLERASALVHQVADGSARGLIRG